MSNVKLNPTYILGINNGHWQDPDYTMMSGHTTILADLDETLKYQLATNCGITKHQIFKLEGVNITPIGPPLVSLDEYDEHNFNQFIQDETRNHYHIINET